MPRTSNTQRANRTAVGPLLHVFMHGMEIAHLSSTREGRVKLTYLEGASKVTRGLSYSMPTSGVEYRGDRVANWLDCLLPDRGEVLTRWRTRYELTRRDAYALLWHVGEDVAGAAQFIRPDRLGLMDEAGYAQPISEAEIAARIRSLIADATSWAPSAGTGQFSLAGAQAKFALAQTLEGWAEPTGHIPTTHIFKPAIPGMVDQDLNEHLTMRLAHQIGLPVAPTQLVEFDGARALVVSRFDRYLDAQGTWRRIHQEDAVQALGLSPLHKYESQGGPGVRALEELLKLAITGGHALEDVNTFLDAVAFNWLVVGTDAHARNYALLHHGQSMRLAPLYDLNSFLPYLSHRSERPSQLAMRIGFTEANPTAISRRDWEELARDCRVDEDALVTRVRLLGERLLVSSKSILLADEVGKWRSDLPTRLHVSLIAHVERCLQQLK